MPSVNYKQFMSGKYHAIRYKLLRLEAKINKFVYFTCEIVLALFSRKKIDILFSLNNERQEDIKKSFRLLPHTISFDEFTYEKLQKQDLVIPLSLNDIRRINMHPELAKRNPISIPTNESMDVCDDKYRFYHTLAKKGFEKHMPRVGKNLKMPFVVKKKIAHMGLDCYIVDTQEKVEKYKNEINDPEYFCQDIVEGPKEYATHLLFKGGKVVYALNVIYIFSTPTYVKGRDKFICNRLGKCPHHELFASMLDAIGFEGLCCFNYKEIDGKPYVFEINPRFGGSLAMFFFSFLRHLEFSEEYSTLAYKQA